MRVGLSNFRLLCRCRNADRPYGYFAVWFLAFVVGFGWGDKPLDLNQIIESDLVGSLPD